MRSKGNQLTVNASHRLVELYSLMNCLVDGRFGILDFTFQVVMRSRRLSRRVMDSLMRSSSSNPVGHQRYHARTLGLGANR